MTHRIVKSHFPGWEKKLKLPIVQSDNKGLYNAELVFPPGDLRKDLGCFAAINAAIFASATWQASQAFTWSDTVGSESQWEHKLDIRNPGPTLWENPPTIESITQTATS